MRKASPKHSTSLRGRNFLCVLLLQTFELSEVVTSCVSILLQTFLLSEVKFFFLPLMHLILLRGRIFVEKRRPKNTRPQRGQIPVRGVIKTTSQYVPIKPTPCSCFTLIISVVSGYVNIEQIGGKSCREVHTTTL